MAEITLVRNDRNYWIQFHILDPDSNPIDLTDCTPKLKIESYSTSFFKTITGEVVNAESGICRFKITDEFTDITGEFRAEIELEYANGQILTAPNITIKVLPDLPR